MLKSFEKSWPFVSILFIFAIPVTLFLWPTGIRLVSLLVMGLGLAALITFTVRKRLEAYHQGKINSAALRRNILLDVGGILLTLAVVMLAAGYVSGRVARAAGEAWGPTAGLLLALAAGLVVGFGLGWAVKAGWSRLTKARPSAG